ncbi:hypothetical protein AB0I95_15785 [Micromonospora sp. NPDC049751]|uniref:hypothetical protein n=1 Tax=unclassified Micromonospora TaxID=2617518 RepID=UPI0033E6AB1D
MAHSNPEDRKRYAQAHYAANKSAYKARAVAFNKKNREKLAALVRQAKSKPCADCNVQYPPYVMQFDHVRGEKSFNIGEFAGRNISIARMLAEMDLCEVVCANCHAERTHRRGRPPQQELPQRSPINEALTLF